MKSSHIIISFIKTIQAINVHLIFYSCFYRNFLFVTGWVEHGGFEEQGWLQGKNYEEWLYRILHRGQATGLDWLFKECGERERGWGKNDEKRKYKGEVF